MPPQPSFTREEILEVPCIICNAKKGQPCTRTGKMRLALQIGFHTQRVELRAKMPSLAPGEVLSATDKALICYYAYVMLCDSCCANSEKLFGKVIASVDIQRMFARKAVAALKEDGLLG